MMFKTVNNWNKSSRKLESTGPIPLRLTSDSYRFVVAVSAWL